MVSGMKVGWLVVGTVSLLTATVMVASRPPAFTLRTGNPSSSVNRPSSTLVGVAPVTLREPPTVVELQSADSAPVLPDPLRPCGAIEELSPDVYEPLVAREEPETEGSAAAKNALRFLFHLAPALQSGESESDVSPPPLTLPAGMRLPEHSGK